MMVFLIMEKAVMTSELPVTFTKEELQVADEKKNINLCVVILNEY